MSRRKHFRRQKGKVGLGPTQAIDVLMSLKPATLPPHTLTVEQTLKEAWAEEEPQDETEEVDLPVDTGKEQS